MAVSKTPRYDWIQSMSQIIIDIFEKNVSENLSTIEFRSDLVRCKLTTDTNQEFELNIYLEKNISPQDSYSIFTPTKVQLFLAKSEHINWNKLMNANFREERNSNISTKNWDRIAREMLSGDKQEDVLNFFQDIYQNGDENLRRAMNKSFIESEGTVLSTNWSDVSQARTEIKPPEGTEYKKY